MILASVSTISTAIGRSNDRNRGLGGSRDPAFLANRARDHGRRRNNLATNTSSAPPCCRERQLLARCSATLGALGKLQRPLQMVFNLRRVWRANALRSGSERSRQPATGPPARAWQSRKSGSLRWNAPGCLARMACFEKCGWPNSRTRNIKSPCFDARDKILTNTFGQMHYAARYPMPNAQDLIERARMFEERAERASDPISRQHYREMAAHYRSLAVEHQEIMG